jgi:hypothetical protein
VLYHLLPGNLAHAYRQLFPYGMFILYALLFVGALWPLWKLSQDVATLFLSFSYMAMH